MLTADLFKGALVRERERADRFDEAFALVLILCTRPPELDSQIDAFAKAVSFAARETDIVGWFERPAVLGLIRPFAADERIEHGSTVAARVHADLSRCVGPDELARCDIRADVYSRTPETVGVLLQQAFRKCADSGNRTREAIKRALDIAGSAALLILLLPVFVVIAALIKLTSGGPVLYRQERVGRGGKSFTMLKFRTMFTNADEGVHREYVTQFIAARQAGEGDENRVFKIIGDSRVTRLGHLLRRSSLDELPQFWNVLKGEMSLVGPRPPLPYEVEHYKRWHRRRLTDAKPGVTGLWQVKGRSQTTFDEMVRLDLRYAKTQSLRKDLEILLATPRAVVTGKGAH